MKKFMNCLKMKKGSLNIPPFPSLSFFNFSIYYHAKPHTITETHIQTRKLRAVTLIEMLLTMLNNVIMATIAIKLYSRNFVAR